MDKNISKEIKHQYHHSPHLPRGHHHAELHYRHLNSPLYQPKEGASHTTASPKQLAIVGRSPVEPLDPEIAAQILPKKS
ncbi:hypothetical protein LIER_38973 [Lithospermum erythrorhizon]|uniref:Uncharacterized protein n=1 Tax=Lithospermum erythrorhizon TaxID=34254 RepID=A0AAV3Q822_LITER